MSNPEAERIQQQGSIFDGLIGVPNIEVQGEQIDTFEGNYQLEYGARAAQFIRSAYSQPDLTPTERALAPLYQPMHAVPEINNQYMVEILPAFLEEDPEKALGIFRAVIPSTTDQEMVALTNDTQFEEIRHGLREHMSEIEDDIQRAVHERLDPVSGSFQKIDTNQFNDSVDRSLETVEEQGISITIDPEHIDELEAASVRAGEGVIPVLEHLKNDGFLGVSGFMGSKISLAIHDIMDHAWTFMMVREAGLFDKFSELFSSIGNPELTDIYKREGEIIASIAFGVRYHQQVEGGFKPRFRSSEILGHLERLFIEGELGSNHSEAMRYLMSLKKGSREWQSLGFVFSNYITELDEQRRKHGRIKQRDPKTREQVGELDPLGPDYMAFFIETHKQLMSSRNKHRNNLFRCHILIEEFLNAIASGHLEPNETLTVVPSKLDEVDFRRTTLPPTRLEWMFRNFGFTATRMQVI